MAKSAASEPAARASGRRHDQSRPLLCQRSILNRADGSAKWSQEHSSVVAAVYGPRQAGIRKEDAEKAVVEVTFRSRAGLPGAKEAEFELLIRQTVEAVVLASMHPRTSISVVLQVEREDGSLLACALNAACAALVDAGVPMSAMFVAASCAVMEGGAVFMDPDLKEEEEAVATATFAYTHHCTEPAASDSKASAVVSPDVLTCSVQGRLKATDAFQLAELCRVSCKRIADFVHGSLEKTFQALMNRR